MAVCGVIAEYNPFHRGHMWQLAEIRRRLGGDTAIVSVMSGNFVQRGEFAICGKHPRAEMALRGGADLVLEIPSPWSCATAEVFAQGGVAVLAAAGVVTHMAFGSECGDLEPLRAAAECMDREEYRAGLRRYLDGGMAFAAARQAAVGALAGDAAACLSQPNNNLAVEYLRALRRMDTDIRPMALPRIGAGHDSGEPGPYSSASAIRRRVLAGESWRELLPEASASILAEEIAAGRGPVDMARCQRAMLFQLRRMEEEAFLPFDGGNEGLYHRFYDAVHQACTLEEALAAAKTKRYSMARLRRLALHACLDLRPASRDQTPPYIRVLGANKRGRELLREMRREAKLPVLVKPADARKLDPEARTLFAREAGWTDLYTLAYPALDQAKPGSEYTKSPVME